MAPAGPPEPRGATGCAHMMPPEGLGLINARLAAAFGSDVVADRMLQTSDRALVALGRDGDVPVVVKLFLTADPSATIAALRAEHAAIAPHMATGPFRLASWRRLDAGQGVAVLTQAPGERLDLLLARPDCDRDRVIGLAGGWLAAFAAPRRFLAPMNLHPVVRRRKEAAAGAPLSREDRDLFRQGLAQLRQLARDLAGQDLVQSGIHADLTPYNLHLDDGPSGATLWAFDLQGTRRRPVALDAATFLVLVGVRFPRIRPAPLAHGLPGADIRSFGAACPDACGPGFAFFVGDRLLRSLHEATPLRLAAARTALQGWLA